MYLHEYLESIGVDPYAESDVQKASGVKKIQFGNIASGKSLPSLRTSVKIWIATGRRVTPPEILAHFDMVQARLAAEEVQKVVMDDFTDFEPPVIEFVIEL